jgi:hypothetical protein
MNQQPVWIAGLIGALAPYLVKMITATNLGRKWKSLIALFVAAAIGFCSTFLSGQFSVANLLGSMAAAFTASQIVYDQFFKDLL